MPHAAHMTQNHLYDTFLTSHSVDALLCVLLEFRIGGILEGMQLERVDISQSLPRVGGFVIRFWRGSDTWFLIDTSDALTGWPEDKMDAEWYLESDLDTICHSLQEQLARLVVSHPPKDKKRVISERH